MEEESPQNINSAEPQKGNRLRSTIIGIAVVFVLSLLPAAAFAGIWSGSVGKLMREPAPNTTALAGNINCTSWDGAPSGYKDAIEKAANEFSRVGDKLPIQPALLGAVFLSEHGNSWPQKAITETNWNQGGNGIGPFQIENFDNKWMTVSRLGLVTGDGNPNNFDDAAIAAGGVLYEVAHFSGIPINTSNQNEIQCLAAGYNGGPDMCKRWKNSGYSQSDPPNTTKKYHERAWVSFQELNGHCSQNLGSGIPVPFLTQNDPEWKNDRPGFGSGDTIGQKGCGLTSLAMIDRFFNKNSVSPMDVANDIKRISGSTPDLSTDRIVKFASQNGMKASQIGSADKKEFPLDAIKSELNTGHPVLWQINSSGGYTPPGTNRAIHTNGHFVVITGIDDKNNSLITNNPTGNKVRVGQGTANAMGFEFSTNLSNYASPGFNFWAFDKK